MQAGDKARDREECGGWMMEEGARRAWPWGLGPSPMCARRETSEGGKGIEPRLFLAAQARGTREEEEMDRGEARVIGLGGLAGLMGWLSWSGLRGRLGWLSSLSL